MANFKQLRNRVKSITATQKITKAMHLVSASKLKKLKETVAVASGCYNAAASAMQSAFNSGCTSDALGRSFFTHTHHDSDPLLILFSSERGLCGSFNSNLVKKIKYDISMMRASGSNARLMVIGKKGYEALKNEYEGIIIQNYYCDSGSMNSVVESVGQHLLDLIVQDKISTCYLYFNEFADVLTQHQKSCIIHPFTTNHLMVNGAKIASQDKNIETEGDGLLLALMGVYINAVINYAAAHSRCSEEAIRMVSMDNATSNADDLINSLVLALNRARQAGITQELSEIVAGAESV
ncbi:ATP synthase gamma chain [Rickettsiales endosymbiont of Paramecium tredecaurelia]|uniref:ATP synthase F1 subunit gamma n=1 Tax=Candidatus Sarmatiella mevalonica TaxID=2770581 RepID=UPI001923B475|nr:ATP synthase F1 subunit gamma [Candidatus Sarmatiella mevalonica]MBL3284739.1 ATP synthase gamma chain [Candidatus Sarmatiella mevalonica]